MKIRFGESGQKSFRPTNVLKNKAVLGGICLLLAAVVAFWLLPRMYRGQNATVTIARPAQNIAAGTCITTDMVTMTEAGAFGLPNQVLRRSEDVIGMVAASDISEGTYFLRDSLMTVEAFVATEETKTLGLDSKSCMVTIAVSKPAAAVASILRGGSRVDVYNTIDEEDGKQTQKVLSNLYVYDVLNGAYQSLSEVDKLLPAAEGQSYDATPAYIVFRCSHQEARVLIHLGASGGMHLTLLGGVK